MNVACPREGVARTRTFLVAAATAMAIVAVACGGGGDGGDAAGATGGGTGTGPSTGPQPGGTLKLALLSDVQDAAMEREADPEANVGGYSFYYSAIEGFDVFAIGEADSISGLSAPTIRPSSSR